MSNCPLCDQKCDSNYDRNKDAALFLCEHCGYFAITEQAKEAIKKHYILERYMISSYTIESYLLGRKTPLIGLEGNKDFVDKNYYYITINEIINEKFPKNVNDILDRILLNLSKIQDKDFGKWIEIVKNLEYWNIFYSNNYNTVQCLLGMLEKNGLIETTKEIGAYNLISSKEVTKKIRLSLEGWNKVYELEKGSNLITNQVFVAMWFDKSMDKAWEKGFKPAIEDDTGLKAIRIDLKEHNEKICDVIIAEIRKSKFLVADFTGNRGGVYFEAGFAKGLGIPVIFTCKKGTEKELHFDTRQFNHIIWENPEDLKIKLKNRIYATIPVNVLNKIGESR